MLKNEIAEFLIAMGNFLNNLTDEEYNKFLKCNYENSESSNFKVKRKSFNKQFTSKDMDEIIAKINTANSREEVKNILSNESALSLKDNLVKIARSFKIMIQKIDKREDIENKIIEFTIGNRLSKDAIRGLNLNNNQNDTNKEDI